MHRGLNFPHGVTYGTCQQSRWRLKLRIRVGYRNLLAIWVAPTMGATPRFNSSKSILPSE